MARHYASKYGTFLSPDPGHVGADPGDPRSWNAYNYVANDPINLVDPSGRVYRICGTDAFCFEMEDSEYPGLVAFTLRETGVQMPWDVFGTAYVDCGGGVYCISVEYLDRTGAFEFLDRWFDGSLPQNIYYGANDPKTIELSKTQAVRRDRDEFIRRRCPAKGVLSSGHEEAAWDTLTDLLVGPPRYTELQVGGYDKGTIVRNANGTITFTILNVVSNSSWKGRSYLAEKLGLGNANPVDNPNGKYGKRHNVNQVFHWTEPNPCK